MYGRYVSLLPPEAIARLFRVSGSLPDISPSWNVAPGQPAMVVRCHPKTDTGGQSTPDRPGHVQRAPASDAPARKLPRSPALPRGVAGLSMAPKVAVTATFPAAARPRMVGIAPAAFVSAKYASVAAAS
jgi:hypothetical protein